MTASTNRRKRFHSIWFSVKVDSVRYYLCLTVIILVLCSMCCGRYSIAIRRNIAGIRYQLNEKIPVWFASQIYSVWQINSIRFNFSHHYFPPPTWVLWMLVVWMYGARKCKRYLHQLSQDSNPRFHGLYHEVELLRHSK